MFRVNTLSARRSRRHPDPLTTPRRAHRLVAFACLSLVLILLASCGSSGSTPDDRSFANDPAKQHNQPTATLTVTSTDVPTPTPTPAPSPAALLRPRGAAPRFYVAVGGQLLTITDQGTARRIDLPQQSTLLGFDWSPNGEQVAVAIGRPGKKKDETAVSLVVLDEEGKTVRTVPDVLILPAARATPTPGTNAGARVMVDWGLVGNQLAVATDAGALVVIPASGKPKPVATDLKGQTIRVMRISPQGDAAALLLVDGSQRGTVASVSLVDAKPQAPKPLAGYGVDTRYSATAFAWVPDGRRMLYTQAAAGDDPSTGGELYLLDTKTKERRLIDTGGRAGPSAGITAFIPSPDAKTVAYVIGVNQGATWIANSLWVRSLRDSTQLGVPIGSAESVDGLWWTAGGLVWATRITEPGAAGSYQLVFFQQPPEGNVHELLRVTVKRGVAGTSPASPVAFPVGTPAGGPAATPASTKRG
jgi:hypothetical protein